MKLEGSSVLVTGGAGFIGSHIAEALLERGCRVTVIDNFFTGSKQNLSGCMDGRNFSLVESDIRDPDRLRSFMEDVDVVYHQAAVVSVKRSVENPALTHEVNVTGTLNLLGAALDAGVRRFVYASSSSVYGDTPTLPKGESLPAVPLSPYGVSKLAGEKYCTVYHEAFGLPTVSLRYFNVYGPRQTAGPYSGVISIFIDRVLSGKPPVIDGDGEQTRDFTSVRDVVQANLLAAEREEAVGEVFNVAAGARTSINRLAATILKLSGRDDLELVHGPPRPGDIRDSLADISKAKRKLDYNPTVDLESGLDELIRTRIGGA